MDAGSAYALKRFGWKLAILTAFALAQVKAPWGFKGAAITLALISGTLSFALALYWRERPRAGALNHWDEAVAFFGIAGLVHWLF
jgi:hypothetical protein